MSVRLLPLPAAEEAAGVHGALAVLQSAGLTRNDRGQPRGTRIARQIERVGRPRVVQIAASRSRPGWR